MRLAVSVDGELIERNLNKGIFWLEKAARAGDNRARYWAGDANSQIYRNASSEQERFSAIRRAESWWKKITDDADAPIDDVLNAQRRLGLLYIRLSEQDDRGWDLLMDAADKGHLASLRSLHDFRKLIDRLYADGHVEVLPIAERLNDYFAKTSSPED